MWIRMIKMNKVEIWKDIKGYEGKYQVSNTGKVRSLNYNNTGKVKELKLKLNRYGYYEVKLSKNNKAKDFMVGKLVAEHFLEYIIKNDEMEVMHIKDSKNNEVENLRYAYRSEILHNMYKKGSRKIGKPSDNIITYRGKSYKNYSSIGKDYGIDRRNFFKRMYRGWTLDEITKIPVKIENKGNKPYFYDYYGRRMTVYQISKLTGISAKLINKRLGRGWNIYEASEVMKGEKEVK